MTPKYSRTRRVAKEIHKNIALILLSKIRDPRIGMATVSGVKVSSDLAYATVFVSFHTEDNTPEKLQMRLQSLQYASNFIRSLLGKTMYLRIVPELIFTYDNSIVEGIRITNMISKVVQQQR